MKRSTKPERRPVAYNMILSEIQGNLDLVDQWLDNRNDENWLSAASQCAYKAEVLIELLEVLNCGSVKGFDRVGNVEQQKHRKYRHGLKARYLWLKEMR